MCNKKTKYIDQKYFDNTIFVISTPQEAVGMAILAKDKCVKYCIIISYIGYMEGKYIEIINEIIKNTHIKNIFSLSLYLYQVRMHQRKVFHVIKELRANREIISQFDKEKFDGQLFQGLFNFVAEKDSPILTMRKYDENKIFIMEHSPADSLERIKKMSGKHSTKGKIELRSKRVYGFKDSIDKVYGKVKEMIIKGIVYFLAPQTENIQYLMQGFTWCKCDTVYSLLDYRDYEVPYDFSSIDVQLLKTDKTLLMVDHKEAFRDITVAYEEVKKIDYIKMYLEIVLKSVRKDEFIIFKFHPFISEKLTREDIKKYAEALKETLNANGFNKVFYFEEIIKHDIIGKMPVEAFLKPLKINKIVGLFSSTMLIAQDWGTIEVIADVSKIKFFQEAFKRCKEGIPIKFKVYE